MWSFNAFCPKANPQFSSPRLMLKSFEKRPT